MNQKFSLYLPVSQPVNPTNLFGANVETYEKMMGQKGHPGLDFMAPSGTPCYAPCDGMAQYVTDPLGGDGIWIWTPLIDGIMYAVILWHLFKNDNPIYPFSIPTDGSKSPVKTGKLLAYTDNSGAPRESSGPHLHLGVIPYDANGKKLYPDNGTEGCIDPMPFLTGKLAMNIPVGIGMVGSVQNILSQIQSQELPADQKASMLSELGKVVQFIQTLI